MAGILNAAGVNNGFTSWWDAHRNALTNFGAGLANGTNLQQGIAAGTQGLVQGAQQDTAYATAQKAEQERLDGINKTAAWLKQNYPQFADLPPQQGFDIASKIAAQKASPGANDPADVATYKFYANQEVAAGRNPKSFADWTAGTRPGIKGSLGPPLSFVDPATKQIHPIQKFTDGSTIDMTTGQPPAPSLVYDPSATAQATAAGTTFGNAQGGAQFNIPAAKQNIDMEMANIDAIMKDNAGLDQKFGNVGGISVGGIGYPNQWAPTIPNTPRAGLEARVSQVVGENFLQAYASLKGAGAITEVEGAKAQDAMARLSAAQSKEDFLAALNDLKGVLQTGYARMGTQAGSTYQPTGFTPPPLSNGNADPVSAADALLSSGKY